VAATLAYALLRKDPVPASMTNSSVDNGAIAVPAVLLVPVAVTRDNIQATVIADGFWRAADVCTAEFAAACAAAGVR
jgi:D-xylose transport system substrate-binding protein